MIKGENNVDTPKMIAYCLSCKAEKCDNCLGKTGKKWKKLRKELRDD